MSKKKAPKPAYQPAVHIVRDAIKAHCGRKLESLSDYEQEGGYAIGSSDSKWCASCVKWLGISRERGAIIAGTRIRSVVAGTEIKNGLMGPKAFPRKAHPKGKLAILLEALESNRSSR